MTVGARAAFPPPAPLIVQCRTAIVSDAARATTSESRCPRASPRPQQINYVLLQLPDAAQDSFGQLHIRGDHNGLQFRLNGVILPDGISVFGQTLPPRLIASLKELTGSLPAEYGLRSAGIIDLTTNSGVIDPGGTVSLYSEPERRGQRSQLGERAHPKKLHRQSCSSRATRRAI